MPSLVFVYNANSGPLNGLLDSAHKILHPASYKCSLCALTHHSMGQRKLWKQFRSQAGIPFQFLHKDEFKLQHPQVALDAPAIFNASEKGLEVFISRDELDKLCDLDSLIDLLSRRIDTRMNT